MKQRFAVAIGVALVFGNAQLKLSPTVLQLSPAVLQLSPAVVRAQAPALPQGATQPGPPGPRPAMPPRDGTAAPAPTGTARIRGRVVAADNGTPLRRAQVRISAPEVRINRIASTDAEGRYEFPELPAGRYTISVTRSGYVSLSFGQQRPFEQGRPLDLASAQEADKIDFALTPVGGAGMFGAPVTNDLGEFRLYSLMPGTYVVSAAPADSMFMAGPAAATPVGAQDDGHGVTYYPGTINVDEAQSITVGLAEVANASFALVPQRMTRISGIVRDSQGKPFAATLMLRTPSGASMSMRPLAMTADDGRFSAANVPPGEHVIEVSPRPPDEESALVPITAGGQDITDLLITTHPGITISGRVVFEGGLMAAKSARVIASSPEPGSSPPMRVYDNLQGVVDEKGHFRLRGLYGRATFNVFPAAPGPGAPPWFLKSVTLNGSNITDMPVDVSTLKDDSTLEIVLTDKVTNLSGTVRNGRGQPVIDYSVVIFPDQLIEGMMATRYTRVVRPDQQGRFETRGLPPGNYLAAAIESLEQGGHWDPAFRKHVEPNAKRFRLAEGQTATIDLTLMQ